MPELFGVHELFVSFLHALLYLFEKDLPLLTLRAFEGEAVVEDRVSEDAVHRVD